MTELTPEQEAAKELVIRTTPKGQLALDQYVTILADYRECQTTIEFWRKRLEKLKSQMAEIMGDWEVGTVNGDPVFFYQRQERFNSTEFRKQYPDMYRLYTREIVEKKFDPEWLRQARPDLYEEFQVKAMRITFDT
jgi:hypothetical protein